MARVFFTKNFPLIFLKLPLDWKHWTINFLFNLYVLLVLYFWFFTSIYKLK